MSSPLIDEVLGKALSEAAASNEALKARAFAAVIGLQNHVGKNPNKVMAAGSAMMLALTPFGAKFSLTPGELALVLAASIHNVLLALPEMTPELARAIAIELAGGPRSE